MQILLLFSVYCISMYKRWNYSLPTESLETVPVLFKHKPKVLCIVLVLTD